MRRGIRQENSFLLVLPAMLATPSISHLEHLWQILLYRCNHEPTPTTRRSRPNNRTEIKEYLESRSFKKFKLMLKLKIFYWKLLGISIKIQICQCQTRIQVKLINETGFNSYKKRKCKIFFLNVLQLELHFYNCQLFQIILYSLYLRLLLVNLLNL